MCKRIEQIKSAALEKYPYVKDGELNIQNDNSRWVFREGANWADANPVYGKDFVAEHTLFKELIDKLERDNAALVEALQFYADQTNGNDERVARTALAKVKPHTETVK